MLGPFDVKVSAVDNYNRWEQLYGANPEAVALIGLCAPDVTSLGKLNAANGDKFVAGGYDLTELNLKAVKEGHAYVTIGQSAFVQGYLPVALLVNAIKGGKKLSAGFYNAGSQIVTADKVDMGNGLPSVSFDEAQKLAAIRPRRQPITRHGPRRLLPTCSPQRQSRSPRNPSDGFGNPFRDRGRSQDRPLSRGKIMSGPPMISVRNLAKRYGGVIALQDMSLHVERATIHAVVGENGAGKSTLMKVLAGVVRPDSGAIELDGHAVTIDSPNAARQHGIGMVYQELSLFPERSVLANLFVNREPVRSGLISKREMEARSSDLLRQLGLHVDVHAPVSRLSIGERQLVELARVLLEHPRLLILDEPNSAPQPARDRAAVHGAGRAAGQGHHHALRLASAGGGFRHLRSRHDHPQRTRCADEGSFGTDHTPGHRRHDRSTARGIVPTSLAVDGRRDTAANDGQGPGGGRLADVSFTARSGEIVGLAGLEGSGVADLLDMLFGMRRARGGEVQFPDGSSLPKSATEAARRSVCLVPADRRRNGLMLDKSILFNISNVVVGARDWGTPWYSPKTALDRSNRQIDALRIKGLPHALANSLSGGNQQKVVIGKWLEIGPQVFLLDDPTRGVDIGAKREIYALIREMSANGGIVLFSSTELPELIGLCDRILVLYQGRLAGEVTGAEMNSHTVLHLTNTGEMPGANRSKPVRQGDMA